MPELPDMEVLRRYLDGTSLSRLIERAEVLRPSMLEGILVKQMEDALRGCRLVGTVRHGKYLLARTDGRLWLTLRFGMRG